MMSAIIRVEDVHFAYPESEPVFDCLNQRIEEGEFLLVTGSSGSGKSTFLRLLNGLIPNFSGGTFGGRVTVAGLDTLKNPTRAIASKVSFVFQDPECQMVMGDVEAEIAFALENQALEPELIRERIIEAAAATGITDLLNRRTSTLSCGQMQRVA